MTPVDTSKAAELLAWSRRERVQLPGFPVEQAPRDLVEGYSIQVATARMREMQVIAFKVGLTNAESQRALGAAEPIAGRLTAADVLRSPARIAVHDKHLRVVEAEVVFEIGRDLPAARRPFTEAAVQESISGAFGGIEICDSRFTNGDELSLAHLVADNSNADLLVVGDRIASWPAGDFANLTIVLTRSSGPPAVGSPARVLGHPVKALAWLANWLAARGEGLQRGQLVATGTCTGIVEAAPSDVVIATFGTQAKVSVEFVPEGTNEVTS